MIKIYGDESKDRVVLEGDVNERFYQPSDGRDEQFRFDGVLVFSEGTVITIDTDWKFKILRQNYDTKINIEGNRGHNENGGYKEDILLRRI